MSYRRRPLLMWLYIGAGMGRIILSGMSLVFRRDPRPRRDDIVVPLRPRNGMDRGIDGDATK